MSNLPRKLKVTCPLCNGYRGEVWEESLTEAERNIPPKPFFPREDNP